MSRLTRREAAIVALVGGLAAAAGDKASAQQPQKGPAASQPAGERTGLINFINSHDYVSDVTGEEFIGCLAFIRAADGRETALYTKSLRLQHTLEMAYAGKRKVSVSFWEKKLESVQRNMKDASLAGKADGGFDGPFTLKALWTME